MTSETLLIPILLPAALGALSFLIPSRWKVALGWLGILGAAVLSLCASVFLNAGEITLTVPWLAGIAAFDLRLYSFSAFILLWVGIFGFLVAVYSLLKMREHPRLREYYGYFFFTMAIAGGSVLANNFLVFIFFWEGLLLTLFGLISLGGPNAPRTAIKSFLISAFCDFCLILGISILWMSNGTPAMTGVRVVPEGLTIASFLLMAIGAVGKAGAMPFHTWIPDAALDAPVSVMAFLPAALEKLLGIYLLTRVCLDFFALEAGSGLSIVLMTAGAVTIVLAVLMALIQKDIKKLLSFHAISQVGYMVLGIGTGLPVGIAGGVFHMVNHAIYKSGLFLSAGSVEHRTGTTELKKLGGLFREMPLTAIGFAVCALAISGVWPLNGFVSKEMIFHGALETGFPVFAIAAWAGAVFTFASFLKAGHSIFLGPRSKEIPAVKESEPPIWIPILALAGFCILFGVANAFPLKAFIQPLIGSHFAAEEVPDLVTHALDLFNPVALISLGMLALGLLIHLFGWNRAGKKAYLASEVIHRLPVLGTLYRWSEARYFDLYELGIRGLEAASAFVFRFVERPIDALYETVLVGAGRLVIRFGRWLHNGFYPNYLAWCLAGLVIILLLLRVF
jgi:NADH:ubiquinone oxidoreductase subunit 5 (subunit L)/multisubunit Na+/H+ antiporter MnhA subunit